MESAESALFSRHELSPLARLTAGPFAIGQVATVVLQVDSSISRCHGFAWLVGQRDPEILGRLAALDAEARAEEWSRADLVRGRLALLRPRRAEMNRLSLAYLQDLAPGVADATHRMRRAGIRVELSSEVAIESLFGIAAALGLSSTALRGPSLRFDALGAYRGCDVRAVALPGEQSGTLLVGTAGSDLARSLPGAPFVAFTGFVVPGDAAPTSLVTVGTFSELASWLVA